MAIDINSAIRSTGQPSAPVRVVEIDVDLDDSYPTGGYDVSDEITETVAVGIMTPISDGTTVRYAKIDPDTKKLQVFADDTLDEESNGTDLSAYTGVKVPAVIE